jgi:hypothetical protein
LDFAGNQNVAKKRNQRYEDTPAVLGPYEVYESGERSRGKEAGPALNPL